MGDNVVLITYDSLRADHCGHLGYDRDTTPNLDAMAEAGTTYTNAIAPASRTNPAMAGALTGEPMVVRGRTADPDHARRHLERHGTIAEYFAERGYATGAFCPNAYASRFYGFDRGFDTFEDFMFDSDLYQSLFEEHLSDSGLYTAVRNLRNFVRREEAFKTWDRYVDQVEAWVRRQDEPFFLWVFSLDTHFPYLTPRDHRTWSTLIEMYYYNWRCNQLIDQLDIDLSGRERRKIVDIYDDAVRFGDALIGELRDRLSDFDPVFVVHGDHGEAFGERGVYGHFYPSLYDENVHVPLVVSEPAAGRIDTPVSLLALPDLLAGASESGSWSPEALSDNWVVATDYDGRTDRNLTAVRTRDSTYVRERDASDVTDERLTVANGLEPPDGEDADGPTDETALARLVDRRERHESELLGIRRASRDLDPTIGGRVL